MKSQGTEGNWQSPEVTRDGNVRWVGRTSESLLTPQHIWIIKTAPKLSGQHVLQMLELMDTEEGRREDLPAAELRGCHLLLWNHWLATGTRAADLETAWCFMKYKKKESRKGHRKLYLYINILFKINPREIFSLR